jgi:hypothetical protein
VRVRRAREDVMDGVGAALAARALNAAGVPVACEHFAPEALPRCRAVAAVGHGVTMPDLGLFLAADRG